MLNHGWKSNPRPLCFLNGALSTELHGQVGNDIYIYIYIHFLYISFIYKSFIKEPRETTIICSKTTRKVALTFSLYCKLLRLYKQRWNFWKPIMQPYRNNTTNEQHVFKETNLFLKLMLICINWEWKDSWVFLFPINATQRVFLDNIILIAYLNLVLF